jgi:hypothetical protein
MFYLSKKYLHAATETSVHNVGFTSLGFALKLKREGIVIIKNHQFQIINNIIYTPSRSVWLSRPTPSSIFVNELIP